MESTVLLIGHFDWVLKVAGLDGVYCTNQDTLKVAINQDTLTGPKGGRIRGSLLTSSN